MAEITIRLSEDDVGRIADAVADRIRQNTPAASNGTPLFFKEAQAVEMLGVSVFMLKRLRQNSEVTADRPTRPVGYSAQNIADAAEFLKTRGTA